MTKFKLAIKLLQFSKSQLCVCVQEQFLYSGCKPTPSLCEPKEVKLLWGFAVEVHNRGVTLVPCGQSRSLSDAVAVPRFRMNCVPEFPLVKSGAFPRFHCFTCNPKKPQISFVCGSTQNHVPVLVHRSLGSNTLDKRVHLLCFHSLVTFQRRHRILKPQLEDLVACTALCMLSVVLLP